MSKKLPHTSENVCLGVDDDSVMYAVGSKANTDLLDARTLQVQSGIQMVDLCPVIKWSGFLRVV